MAAVGAGLPRRLPALPVTARYGPAGVTFRRPPEPLGRGGAGDRDGAIPRRHLVRPALFPLAACGGAGPGAERGGGRAVAALLAAGARRRRPALCGGSSRSCGRFRDEEAREVPARAVLRRAGFGNLPPR